MSDETKNTIPQVGHPQVGQRLVWTLDLPKMFKHKDGDNAEIELQRLYQLVLPYGAPFEEIYVVIDELLAEVKRLEVASKEQAEKQKAEAEAKAAEEASIESSIA